ncbi:hypothetical protein [Streptomyces antimicrobicus]|uniref:Uncharacterized protein n=1 Tax=Streptomyces antimicrobicus TaxID=2883108 RepID=A0ABS8BF28_9ACTN|nr:hypothetical protein [Streptomyces antimicrobicus]MCB5183244.1 hypothetical protein [Streptomyces antimicrobicus]
MADEELKPTTPRPPDAARQRTARPPQGVAELAGPGGDWVREELGHGAFEAWHFFPHGSAGTAPAYVFIQPAAGGDPAAVGRGVTTTVLREMRPAEAAGAARRLHRTRQAVRYPLAERVEALLQSYTRPTDAYLAAVALRYERLADAGIRSPVRSLVDITGLPLGTVKSHIQLARRKGLLEAVGAKAGGRATERAHALVAAVPQDAG